MQREFYGYSWTQWIVILVCYGVFFFFGGIEASQSIYYSLIKTELEIPYKIQGWLVSMGSYSFIIGSPIVGYIMTQIDVKPVIVTAFLCYLLAYVLLYYFKNLWVVFVSLFIEGLGGVMLDVGMNTLSTVIFVVRRGVMMNSLHFFYGLGSAVGPTYSSFVYSLLHQGSKGIFLGLMIPAGLGFIFTITTRLSLNQPEREEVSIAAQEDDNQGDQKVEEISAETRGNTDQVDLSMQSTQTHHNNKDELTIWKAFITPMVWLLGISMGAVYAIESVTVNWAPLYLKEMFGMNPEEEGTHFISLFFIYYTVARLLIGFIIDWLGDVTSMLVFNLLLIILYLIGFGFKRNGVWILAFSGFLISPFYPTSITVPMEVFGNEAKNTISVILCLALIVNALIQVVIGYVNEYLGPQWGYPLMSFAMCFLMILCMVITQWWLKKHNGNKTENQVPSEIQVVVPNTNEIKQTI